MLPLELFANRAFTGVQIAAFAISASLFALFLYLTLYLQQFLGNTPLGAGERYLPLTVVTFVVAGAVGRMGVAGRGARTARRRAGAVRARPCPDVRSERERRLDGAAARLHRSPGVGVGIVNTVIADVALSVVPKERSGMAAGINDTFRQVGVAVGIAAWGAIFTARGADKAVSLAPPARGHGRQLVEAVSAGRLHDAVAALPAGARGRRRARGARGLLVGAQRGAPARRRAWRCWARSPRRCSYASAKSSVRRWSWLGRLHQPLPSQSASRHPAPCANGTTWAMTLPPRSYVLFAQVPCGKRPRLKFVS